MLTEAGIRPRVAKIAARHPDHGEGWGEAIFSIQRIERGDQLALGQVATRAEDYDGCGWRRHLTIERNWHCGLLADYGYLLDNRGGLSVYCTRMACEFGAGNLSVPQPSPRLG